jgi:pimeloyl-ACP methyl ester carboxylesterase
VSAFATSPDGIAIAYEVVGEGDPAIVFVHGWSCDRTYWRHQIGAFAGNAVVAIDLAGHGESGSGRESWTMAAFGGDVVAVLDQLGIQNAVLVGHSMGGDVIIEAALVLGPRVRGLVWVDTYRSLGDPVSPEDIDAFIAPFRRDFAKEAQAFFRGMLPATSDPELVEWVVADVAAAPPDVALDAMEHAIDNEGPAVNALGKLTVPVVAINPDYRPTDEESLRRYGVRPVIVAGVGHFLMLEDPARFNAALADVVTGLGT